jgi:hypothetical protein
VKRAARSAVLAICLLALTEAATAALAPWDQAKVTELAKQLEAATRDLETSFRKQPTPAKGTPQSTAYWRLKQEVRHLRREARSLSRALQRGADREETLPSYDSLMQTVRSAQTNARRVFTVADVIERANTAREILNQLMPFFDPNAEPLQPVGR